MSKKKKSIMDGYFDEPMVAVEINPFVEEIPTPKLNPDVLKKLTKLGVPVSSHEYTEILHDFKLYDNDMFSPMGALAKNIKDIDKKTESKQSLNGAENTIKPLDIRETGVSSALDKPLDNRETGVSSALDKPSSKRTGVSSALDKPLDNRETGVRKIENSALEISQLVGKEKSLLLIIHDECKKLGELETNFIGTDNLKILLSIDSLGLRNLIFRVKKKGFFEVTSKQLGRVGLRKFKISRTIYQQILSSALDIREAGVSSALDKPLDKPLEMAPYSSSSNNYNINTNTIELPENLRRFGISVVNLQNLITSGKTTKEIVENSLTALSFDIEHGKTGNIANILFGVLGTGREYISQKYSESLQEELEQELERIRQAEENQKRSVEMKLVASFKEYLGQHPGFLDSVKDKHNGFVTSSDLLEKVAFEEYKNLGVES